MFSRVSDTGISLVHNKQPVVDILALNCGEFDVSDILATPDNVLHLHDPVTNTTLPVIATNATRNRCIIWDPRCVLVWADTYLKKRAKPGQK